MRSSGRHSNETTKSKERKDGRYRARGGTREKRCAYGRVKKGGRNVEMQTDGVLRSSLVSRLREATRRESYQEPFSPAGRSPHARSLPTLSTNGYLWMHQSTPLLPGFNAIRIDYIDFARGRNLRVVLAKLLTQRVNEPLHLMIFRIGKLLNILCPENINYRALQTHASPFAMQSSRCVRYAFRRVLNILRC